MTSLSTHLRHPETHGALPFHAECPICRAERLVGTPASGGPVSPRAHAALAATVLALNATAPAALAAEQESEHEGSAPVTQTSTTDPSQNPNFDPGGSSEPLPAQAPAPAQNPSPPTAGNDDNGPIEQQPATNASEPVVDNGDGQGTVQAETQPAPQSQTTTESPPPATNEACGRTVAIGQLDCTPDAAQPGAAGGHRRAHESGGRGGRGGRQRRASRSARSHRAEGAADSPAHLASHHPQRPSPRPHAGRRHRRAADPGTGAFNARGGHRANDDHG